MDWGMLLYFDGCISNPGYREPSNAGTAFNEACEIDPEIWKTFTAYYYDAAMIGTGMMETTFDENGDASTKTIDPKIWRK